MNHPKKIERYNGSEKELSRDIVNLDYDALVKHFENLKNDFAKDAIHDQELNHAQVAQHLANISQALKELLERDMQPMADLCRTYNEKGIR